MRTLLNARIARALLMYGQYDQRLVDLVVEETLTVATEVAEDIVGPGIHEPTIHEVAHELRSLRSEPLRKAM